MYELTLMQDNTPVLSRRFYTHTRYYEAWGRAHHRVSRMSECLGFWIRATGPMYRVRRHRAYRNTRLFTSQPRAWRTAWT